MTLVTREPKIFTSAEWAGWPSTSRPSNATTPCSLFSPLILRSSGNRKLDAEDNGQHHHGGLRLAPFAGDQLAQHISDEAEANSGRDRISQRHRHRGYHRRRVLRDVAPFDLREALRHHAGDIEQRRRCRIGWHHA